MGLFCSVMHVARLGTGYADRMQDVGVTSVGISTDRWSSLTPSMATHWVTVVMNSSFGEEPSDKMTGFGESRFPGPRERPVQIRWCNTSANDNTGNKGEDKD